MLFLLAACRTPVEPPPRPPPPPAPYWVERTDAELDAAVLDACTRAAGKPVLLAFSAPWCHDCNVLRELAKLEPLRAELQGWEQVVIDVGRFERHPDWQAHFGVDRIAYWVAVEPQCDRPALEWRVLRAGAFEPATGQGAKTPGEVASWLVSAREAR